MASNTRDEHSSSAPIIEEVLIDRDCAMCRAFGSSLAASGMTVTPRETQPGQSIEVLVRSAATMDTATIDSTQQPAITRLSGFRAMLALGVARKRLPSWIAGLLGLPGLVQLGELGYQAVARNRLLISRLFFKSAP